MKDPYLLIPIASIILFVYFLSYLGVRIGMVQKAEQRKFWNVVLLITFVTTAILGIVLTVQVNYKLEIPYIKEILVWHVNFGIAMSIIAVIHLIWHLNYYYSLFKPTKKTQIETKNTQETSTKAGISGVSVLMILLGFATSIIQVIILRECLSVFYDNELTIGIILSLWMALTGIGAWLGRKTSEKNINPRQVFFMYLLLGIFPLILVTGVNCLKNIFFSPGILIGVWQFLLLALFLLAPNCLLSGSLFSVLTKDSQSERGSKLYALEALGSILGGIVVSIIMVFWLNSLQSLTTVFVVIVIIMVIYLPHPNKKINITAIVLGFMVFIIFFLINSDLWIRQFLYPNQKILFTRETPYGNLTFTETAGQINAFENLSLLFTNENTMANEETAHFPMLQHHDPKNVLLISGGIAGIAKEVLKYNQVRKLVYVETNPWLVKYAQKFIKLPSDSRLQVIFKDARRFLTSDNNLYDVVIIVLPEPSTLQINRYYTLEFINLIKKHTHPLAVISYSLPAAANYMSQENRALHSSLFNTLKQKFANILILPGEKDYFLASDNKLESSIGKLCKLLKVDNEYVNAYYMDDVSLAERSQTLQNEINSKAEINTDFKPVVTSLQTAQFFSKFNVNYFMLIFVIVLLLLIPLVKLNAISFCIYAAGFTASAIEMIIILVFQIVFGYVYAAAGIIFALFMAGLAIGAGVSSRKNKPVQMKNLVILQIFMTFLALFIPLVLIGLHYIRFGIIIYFVIAVLTIMPACVIGYQFSTALKLFHKGLSNSTGFLYGADLMGSALGLLLVTTILLPLTGIAITSAFIILLNIFAICGLYFSKVRWY